MQKVLRKRVLRNLRRHMGRYFALCLLVILGVFIVVSLLGAAQNIIDGTAEFAQKNRIEDGEWETFILLNRGRRVGNFYSAQTGAAARTGRQRHRSGRAVLSGFFSRQRTGRRR